MKQQFIYGVQYYRAPTPDRSHWETDLQKMRSLGFTHVKFWVQWRWCQRERNSFYLDDVEELMQIASAHGLRVILNTIFDVAPAWLFSAFPDAKQITASGAAVEPRAVSCRPIGGMPGPCYNHSGALEERRRFLHHAVERLKGHSALTMWDVWNEPEQCWPHRVPDPATITCYCPACLEGFRAWLREKYSSLETLNHVWGRCYTGWDQVEAPRDPHVFLDFIDWREYHLDVLTAEAQWRLRMVRDLDPAHIPHLHVVPNTMHPFNSVMCADDFALSGLETTFAFTMHGGIPGLVQAVSAAGGKPCHNAESHINVGFTNLHQRVLGIHDLLEDLLPQIGLGVKGFLFWQHRPESLGWEAPAWGIIRPDGTERPFTHAVRTFGEVLGPCMEDLLHSAPQPAEIGIWKSRKNEIFHFCMSLSLEHLVDSVEAYIEALHWSNYRFRIVSGAMLAKRGLHGIRLLVMPSCYCLTAQEAEALDGWVQDGGVLLCEAHLGAYNGTTGRHSESVPGCGLADSWGIREIESTSSYHLQAARGGEYSGPAPQEMKSFVKDRGTRGGFAFPLALEDGARLSGAYRYAEIGGEDLEVLATVDSGAACIVAKSVGRGRVIYCGTNLGQGAGIDERGFLGFLHRVARDAGVSRFPTGGPGKARIDILERNGRALFMVVVNDSAGETWFDADPGDRWEGLFGGEKACSQDGVRIRVPAGCRDILRRKE